MVRQMAGTGFTKRGTTAALLKGLSLTVCVACIAVLAGCERGGGGPLTADSDARLACPRPAQNASGAFNGQEQDIRLLRKLAFRGDFFAQLDLGRRYTAQKSTDQNLEDPIEASVWYALALTNPEGYDPINRTVKSGFGVFRPLSRYDDCRAYERHVGYRNLDFLLSRMSTEERQKVRDRVIYVLSTRDAEGFRTLARLHDQLYGPFGEPADNPQALESLGQDVREHGRNERPGGFGAPAAVSLFARNDVDAYLYNYLAFQTGDQASFVLLKDFERSSPQRAGYASFVEAKARRWTPPYEFYPPEAPQGGVPHSDESASRGDATETALTRIDELPFVHVGRALEYLGITPHPALRLSDLSEHDIQTLQAALGREMTGRLSPLERVRAIQLAAVSGSSQAQLVLAVMYSEGLGVPADYARAFKWFSEAERQGSPEAKFAMSAYFALGVEGVADQDKAKAVALRLESALAGFKPSVTRLQAVLAHICQTPRH